MAKNKGKPKEETPFTALRKENCCTDTTFSETGKVNKLLDLLKELNSFLEFENEAKKT